MTWDELEELALGQIGLKIDYFYSLTQRQFANVVNGFFKQKDYESRERWVIARKTIHAVLQPHLKSQISELELMKFPWEEELAEQLQEQYKDDYLQEIQKSIEMWERIDEKNNVYK